MPRKKGIFAGRKRLERPKYLRRKKNVNTLPAEKCAPVKPTAAKVSPRPTTAVDDGILGFILDHNYARQFDLNLPSHEMADTEQFQEAPVEADKNMSVFPLGPLIKNLESFLSKMKRDRRNPKKAASAQTPKQQQEDWSPLKKKTVQYLCRRGRKMRGMPLNREVQAIVWNIYQYNKLERDLKRPAIKLTKLMERTACQTKLSINTVRKYVRKAREGKELSTLGKSRQTKARKVGDSFDWTAIESLIYEFHRKRKHFTIDMLLKEIRKRGMTFGGGRETLRKLLHHMGFKYVQKNGSRYLMEQPHVTKQRIRFLKEFHEYYLNQDYNIIFIDETWVFRKGTGKGLAWQNSDIRSCPVKYASLGERYVVISAGGKDGFVPNASKVFSTKKKPSPGDDYNGDLDSQKFLQWFRDCLVPNLVGPSVLVMDNASYHRSQVSGSRNPTSSWLKADIEKWLQDHGIRSDGKLKADLLEIARRHKPEVQLEVDKVLDGSPHRILWLPPYHAIFNAIELIWSSLKGYYEKLVGEGDAFTDANTHNFLEEAQKRVTVDNWRNCYMHTVRVIFRQYEENYAADTFEHPPVVFSVGLSSEETSEYESGEDDSVVSCAPPIKRSYARNFEEDFQPADMQNPQPSKLMRGKNKLPRRRRLFASHTTPEDDVTTVLRQRHYRQEEICSGVNPQHEPRPACQDALARPRPFPEADSSESDDEACASADSDDAPSPVSDVDDPDDPLPLISGSDEEGCKSLVQSPSLIVTEDTDSDVALQPEMVQCQINRDLSTLDPGRWLDDLVRLYVRVLTKERFKLT